MNDATKHDQLMDVESYTGGWNYTKKQFFIGSEDGNFYLHPGIIFQFRGNLANAERSKRSGSPQTTDGFEIRRAKFYFDGNLFTPDLTYKFQWQDNITGSPSLEYGWAQYVFAKNFMNFGDLAIRGGQTKDIVFKEEFVGDTNQLMVERSLANALVGGNQPPSNLLQGVDLLLLGKNTPLHAELELHNGFGSGNTAFTQPHGTPITTPQTPVDPPTNPGNWGVSTRVDYKVFGDWTDTNDFTGVNSGKHDLLDIGAGLDYTDAQGDNAVRYTIDAQYQIARTLSIFGAFYGNHHDFRNVRAGVAGRQNNYGFQIEGGYMLDPALQVVARYDVIALDDKFKTNNQGTFQEIAVGVNWFGPNGSWGNHAKLSADLNYLPDGTPAEGGLDYLAAGRGNNEIVLRTQFQLWF